MPCSPAVWRVEWWTEVRELTSGIVNPSVLARGAFEGRQGLRGPCRFSRPDGLAAPLVAWVLAGRHGESCAGARGSPIPSVAAPSPLAGPFGR